MAANEAAISTKPVSAAGDDSSESDGETEPAKSFHRRFSTNKNIKSSVCTREGFLMKQTSSFQRWRRRYFKLKGRTLYYAKDTKSVIFDEISLPDLSVAECSTKNANHSFQVITPFRSLVLCAESRREMEEWITALKAAANKEYYDSADHHDFLSGRHNWYATSHARPTYCNVCREALSGVTSHGLSCEVCKFKSHKRCAVKAINNCKWTTLASVGKDIIEDDEGNIAMPHQWMEGNLPVSAKCSVCDKTCGSVLRLQDWRCLWCRAMVHTACRPQYPVRCPLGPCRVSIVPPTALHSVGTDEAWDAVRPQGCSPLFVFVNSKSGDNQGVKFLRRFKQLLNPAQVFDLMNGGPGLGLRLFRHFDPFRILICSGDGSIGWVLSEIDKLHMDKQCQIGVLPLGTGNDLARVIGWGSVCDDDAHLPQLLERYEKASVKMLDRWSIFTSERSMPLPRKVVLPYEPITAFEDSIVNHLGKILQSDEHTIVISSAKILCETIKEFIGKMAGLHAADDNASSLASGDESIAHKCRVLNEKLDQLLGTLHEEASPLHVGTQRSSVDEEESPDNVESSEHPEIMKSSKEAKESRNEGRAARQKGARKVRAKFNQREALMSRANSLKKAVRQIIEHAERALDEQNGIVPSRSMHSTSASQTSGMVSGGSDIKLIVTHPNDSPVSNEEKMMKQTSSAAAAKSAAMPMALLQLYSAIGGGAGDSSSEPSPCPSPIPMAPSLTTNFPLLPTSPIRYPNPPVFYRMATPPNTQPQRPRSSSSSPRPPSAGRSCYVAHQESAESEGDEDRSAMLSLQAKLNAISPVPDASETRTSCEFDFSALALPVPLEFADTDSLQDVPIDVFDEDTEGRDNVPSVELDEEPAEVEVKPILRPPQQVNISVVVEPPSSEDSSQARPAKDEVDNSRQAEAAEAAVETEDEDEQEAQETAAIARLGERVVEGAEEPVAERTNAAAAARADIRARRHAQTTFLTTLPPYPVTYRSPTPTSRLTPTPPSISVCRQHEPTTVSRPATRATASGDEASSRLLTVPVSPATSSTTLQPSPTASRRISSGSTLLASATASIDSAAGTACGASVHASLASILSSVDGHQQPRPPSPDELTADGHQHCGKEREATHCGSAATKKRKMPIINPLVTLPMWPNVETGGLISKVLLANADALCAAVSPLMDVEEDPAEMMDEKCVMNSYFGIGIDAKITLDFHMKREEHPEKCRSRARNYMWYGVLGSKEWLQKTYKNLEQRVLLECDGTRIPLPSLQGIVVLNIPSFMGGTNFWGGNKEDDCFIAPSFDDRVLEVVAVFGSVQMAASRIINLQHHRIAQCHSVKITILGDEGVPVQVDGEAWLQPPGLIRIVHKNRMQMLCRNRALERSLEAWQEKQQRYQLVAGHKMLHGTSLSDDENHVLITFLEATTALVRYVRLLAISQPDLDQELYSLATQASTMLDKMHPGGKIIEGPSLRLHLTDLVNIVRQLHLETDHFLKERAALYNLRPNQEKKLSSSLSHVVCELRKCTDINGLVHFITSEEMSEKKSRAVKSSGGGGGGGAGSNSGGGGGGSNSSGGGSSLFRLKFRRPAESRSRSTSQGHRHNEMGSSDSAVNASEVGTGGRPTNTSSSSVDLSLNVHLWGNDEVAVWLESLQLEEYRDDFIRHDIRGSELLTLERRDLKELGIHKVGHIKRIQQAILEIKENARLSHQSS
ncbi:diacylglycerol kinase eta-like isoform X1 [Daphnia carinata]|uniref:diacylglycerol kinase eta-like isoform X1 n=2 Tax=Daphnia carinata TaxID=120202 RepID=UPI00257EEFB5|nr:diacylglycerol kinase eta-like isoform X1 [Daphnia carinata]